LYVYFLVLCMYLVSVCLFSCTALFVSVSQVVGCEDRLRNDLYCVGWGVKLYSTQPVSSTDLLISADLQSTSFEHLCWETAAGGQKLRTS